MPTTYNMPRVLPGAGQPQVQQPQRMPLGNPLTGGSAGAGNPFTGMRPPAAPAPQPQQPAQPAAPTSTLRTGAQTDPNWQLGNTQTGGAGSRYLSSAVRNPDGTYRLPDGRVLKAEEYQQLRSNPALAESLGSQHEQQQEKARLEGRVGANQQMLNDAANGNAPSAAQALNQQLTDAGIQQQLSLARSGAGPNSALAYRTAADNSAIIQQQAANQAVQLRAGEQATARGQAAQYNIQQQQLNDQRAGQQQSESFQRDVQQLMANMSYEQQQEQIRQWQKSYELAKTQADRSFFTNLIGSAMKAIGAASGAGAGG